MRFWVKQHLLRAPLPLTGAGALQADTVWDAAAWIQEFLIALAGEAEDALDLLFAMERAWFAARAAVAGRRRVGFEHEADARRCLDMMRARLEEFAPTLHPEKTRLIEFGRRAAVGREKRGESRPETFDFLGFTMICGKSRRGKSLLWRKSRRDRLQAELLAVKGQLRRRMRQAIPRQGELLRGVISGWFAYHAVPTNARSLQTFRNCVIRFWWRSLRRRGQRDKTTWERMKRLADDHLPKPRILSLARAALRRQTPKVGAVCGNAARTDPCGARAAMRVPTAIYCGFVITLVPVEVGFSRKEKLKFGLVNC